MADRIADIWGARTPHARDTPWPVRVDQDLDQGVDESEVDQWVQSACVLCSNGCACDIAVRDSRMVGVRGRAVDVVNHGRLGPKGLYGSRQWQDRDRLTRPLVREGSRLVKSDWDTAMDRIVTRSRQLLDETGPLSHGFYTSGQLFLEEYYTPGVLGKAGIGTPHMDGNTRLCTATAAAAMKESFGSDGQPGSYTDIESCDALFLFGHNMADPLPGTNQALMNCLVRELIEHDWVGLPRGFGLTDRPPVIHAGLTPARIGVAALSGALTALVLRLLDCPHPPAGATTLIVSLGLLTSTGELFAIAAGVVLVTVLSVALNRVLGVRQPTWS